MKRLRQLWVPALAVALIATGCRGIPVTGEKAARHNAANVGAQLQTNSPALAPNSTLHAAVLFAVKNHPQVIAAYADWAGAVENVTVARSRPDPRINLDLSIVDAVKPLFTGQMSDMVASDTTGDSVQSVTLGLETDIPGFGKLPARGAEALAASRAKYFQFATVVQQTAFGVQKSFYPLHFLDARLAVNRQSLALLASLESLARSQNEVGRATLQDVLKAQIEQEQLRTDTANLEDSRRRLLAQFKASLGLHAEQPDPPVPAEAEFSESPLSDDDLFAAALKRNPRLKEMEAEIRVAEAQIRIARKERMPDFTAGISADVKAVPVVWDPQLAMTLPIWRDKLKAELAVAQNTKRAAEARLAVEQINLAADFAEQTYLIREANRTLALLRERLLPRARQSLEVARAAYRSSQVDFLNVIDAERALLNFQLDEIAAQSQREIARAELMLIVAGTPPDQAPLAQTTKDSKTQP